MQNILLRITIGVQFSGWQLMSRAYYWLYNTYIERFSFNLMHQKNSFWSQRYILI